MRRKAILTAAVSAALASLYGCAPDPMPFDPAKFQQNARKTSKDLSAQPMYPMPATLDTTYAPLRPGQPTTRPTAAPMSGQPLDQDPILRLSIQEVLHRAVNNNLDIRVAGYEPAINSNRVVEAEARFDPTFFFSPYYEWRHSQSNPSFLFQTPNNAQKYELFGASAGVRQDLETGGSYELRHETNYIHQFADPTSPFSQENTPYYTNNIVAEIKQPLLQNFGSEVNRARITVARNDQKTSILEFRKQVEETLFSVEQTYWQLLQAQREVEIAERLLVSTTDTAELLTQRSGQDVSRVEVSQANARVQERRALLTSARSRVRELSDQIKRLMNDPELPVASNILILPASETIKQAIHFDPQDQINQALEHRFELAEQILKIDNQSMITRVARNNMLPALNLVNTLTANGAEYSWDEANSNAVDGSFVSDRIGLQFEVPIGQRQAKAIYQRTLLQRQQAIDAYRGLIDQVSLEVKAALRNVQTSWDEMRTYRQAVLANADALDAIMSRERAGSARLDYSFVQLKLDTQGRLADAERSEAQAMANYCIAIAQLERAKGTLLRYDNVMMQEDRLSVLAREKIREKIPESLELMPERNSRVQPGRTTPPQLLPMNNDATRR